MGHIRTKIDEKIKQDVIKAYENGVPRKKIAERFGISLSSVGRIVKKKVPKHSHEKKTETDTKTERQKRIEDLERRIFELEKKILDSNI
ncbi:helix-turn-helix domain-containing protein [Thermodesulfobacteriota bacterium]